MTILVAAAAYSQCGGKNGIPRLPGDGNSETSKSLAPASLESGI